MTAKERSDAGQAREETGGRTYGSETVVTSPLHSLTRLANLNECNRLIATVAA
jgi:hypothetical protein